MISVHCVTFTGNPYNYARVDNYVSRSAQPKKEDFIWLKEQGVTDVFNFRTMYVSDLDFDEEDFVKKIGLKYHSIPSVTNQPKENNINLFLEEIEKVKQNGGKAHIHCKAGADRTGMYAFIYKMKNGIGTLSSNKAEWLKLGHNVERYPNLMEWATSFVKRFMSFC